MAWYRRLYLVNFVNVVTNDKKDQFLIDKLVTKEELEGFAWQCLQRLRRLYSNKFIFTYDMDETKLPALYEKLSNPILMFIDESNHEGRDDWCFKYEFEERLNNWLKIHHFPPMTKSQINQYMKEHYTESVRDAPDYSGGTFGGKSYRVWVGLRWKSSEDLANLPTLPILRGFQNSSYMYNSFEKVVRTVKSVRNSPKQQFKALECITFMDIDGKEVTLEKDHIYNIDIINSNSFKILLDSKKVELEVYK